MGLRPRQHHFIPTLHQGQLGLTQRNGHAVEGQLVLAEEGDGAVCGRAQPLAELFLFGGEGRLVTAAGGTVQVVAHVQGQGRVNQLDDDDSRFGGSLGVGEGEKERGREQNQQSQRQQRAENVSFHTSPGERGSSPRLSQ